MEFVMSPPKGKGPILVLQLMPSRRWDFTSFKALLLEGWMIYLCLTPRATKAQKNGSEQTKATEQKNIRARTHWNTPEPRAVCSLASFPDMGRHWEWSNVAWTLPASGSVTFPGDGRLRLWPSHVALSCGPCLPAFHISTRHCLQTVPPGRRWPVA